MGSEAVISGWVAPGFAVVEDAFAANFHRDEPESELGAALAVYFEAVSYTHLTLPTICSV